MRGPQIILGCSGIPRLPLNDSFKGDTGIDIDVDIAARET